MPRTFSGMLPRMCVGHCRQLPPARIAWWPCCMQTCVAASTTACTPAGCTASRATGSMSWSLRHSGSPGWPGGSQFRMCGTSSWSRGMGSSGARARRSGNSRSWPRILRTLHFHPLGRAHTRRGLCRTRIHRVPVQMRVRGHMCERESTTTRVSEQVVRLSSCLCCRACLCMKAVKGRRSCGERGKCGKTQEGEHLCVCVFVCCDQGDGKWPEVVDSWRLASSNLG